MAVKSYPKKLYRSSKYYVGTSVEITLNGKSYICRVNVNGNIQKSINGNKYKRRYLWAKVHDFEINPEVNKFPLFSASKSLVECIDTGEITYSDETKYVVCSITSDVLLRSEAEMYKKAWVKKGWGRILSAHYNFTTLYRYTEQAIDAFKKRYPTLLDFYKRVKEILGQHWDGDIANVPEGYDLHHNHKTGYVVGFTHPNLNRGEGSMLSAIRSANTDYDKLMAQYVLDELQEELNLR